MWLLSRRGIESLFDQITTCLDGAIDAQTSNHRYPDTARTI